MYDHNSSSNAVCQSWRIFLQCGTCHVSFINRLANRTSRSDHEVVAGELPGGVERQLVLADPAHGRRGRHLRLGPRPARLGPAHEPVLAAAGQTYSDAKVQIWTV